MVPSCEEEVIIVAAFRREDLVRLHTLLMCYESPFRTTGEAADREVDTDTHAELRRYIEQLLVESRGGTL